MSQNVFLQNVNVLMKSDVESPPFFLFILLMKENFHVQKDNALKGHFGSVSQSLFPNISIWGRGGVGAVRFFLFVARTHPLGLKLWHPIRTVIKI